MKKTWKQIMACVSAAALAAASVSGCGGSGKTETVAQTTAAQTAAKEEEAKAENAAEDAASGDKIVIKIAHVSQEGVPIDVASRKLGEMLSEKTGGRITVNVFVPCICPGQQHRAVRAASDGDIGNGHLLCGIPGSVYRYHKAFGSSLFVPVK